MKRIRLLLLSLVGMASISASSKALIPEAPIIGADVSWLQMQENKGTKFSQMGEVHDPLRILRFNGFNWVRLRLFVDPETEGGYSPDGYCGLDSTLAMADKVKKAGMQLLLDFHYSDNWADPRKQYVPARWKGLSRDSLAQAIHDYTKNTMQAFIDRGVCPDMVQTGNELNNGMCWPVGDIKNGYGDFSKLLAAGIKGVRDVAPEVPVMVHLARGGNYKGSVEFFDSIISNGVEFDIIGQSYYPEHHGTLDELKTNLNGLAERYGKPISVVEYRDHRKEVNEIVAELPDGLGLGTFIWEATSPRWGNLFGKDGATTEEMKVYPELRRTLPVRSENLPMHDPVMAFDKGRYYIFSTGMGIDAHSSDDMKTWRREPSLLVPFPEWPKEYVPSYRGHTWAPDIVKHDGKWYLYYSCSTFGKNISAIGVALNKTLDPNDPEYKWEDLGLVIKSSPGENNWNAIDPAVSFDSNGKPWMTFGSFWDGIQLVPLADDMKTPLSEPVTVARRGVPDDSDPELGKEDGVEAGPNAIEAPFIVHKDGWYYLIASHDYCCRGLKSNYNTVVGRSRDIQGPYVDSKGNDMRDGGGEILAARDDDYAGVGHCGLYEFDGKWWFVAHGYDRKRNGASRLYLKPVVWADGFPSVFLTMPATTQ
ncbi:MAG: glycosyl hydrolase 53 family protein [Muribaculaceae bacterium]|nr:glycosyl hydrolase 53 family protein [Muribaculaceae bacterium]